MNRLTQKSQAALQEGPSPEASDAAVTFVKVWDATPPALMRLLRKSCCAG